MTKRESAEQDPYLDGKTFDYALPQGWLDDMREHTGEYPLGLFIWLYDDKGGNFGRPYALTPDGWMLLRVYNHIRGTQWPIEGEV